MRKLIPIVILAAIAALPVALSCTPAQQATAKTDTTIAVKTVACSASDWAKAKAILADSSTSEETKLVRLTFDVGPDVMSCLLQAKATTITLGSGS